MANKSYACLARIQAQHDIREDVGGGSALRETSTSR